MKRIFALLLALSIFLSLAACSDEASDEKNRTAESFAEAAAQAEQIYKSAIDRLRDIVDGYLKKLESENPDYYQSDAYFLPMYINFLSDYRPLMAYVYPDSEESDVKNLFQESGYYVSKFEHKGEAYDIDFTAPGEDGELHSRRIEAQFDNASGSFKYFLYDTDSGSGNTLLEFFEFSPQGGGSYAMQDLYTRMFITYSDGEIMNFVISEMKYSEDYSGKLGSDIRKNSPDDDSIYAVTDLTSDWATEKGEDLANIYALSGGVLTVERCVPKIEKALNGSPLSREWLWKDKITIDTNSEA
ncbi:MAG: hypothetical protein ACOX7P_01160 [Oscillospiraceae bacterium]|jgi:hypothetical protein